jgi:hypothetical protein
VNVPPPTPVWLYEPGGPESIRGVLSFDRGAVVFSPAEGRSLRIEAASARSARRHRLTPVLEVRWERGGQDPDGLAFFYFTEPPRLPRPGEKADGAPYQLLLPSKRHIERSGSLLSMRATSKLLKRDIDRWVEAIRGVGRG